MPAVVSPLAVSPQASRPNAVSFRHATTGDCPVKGSDPLRVALCFYGSVRNFNNTLPSIQDSLVAPLRRKAAVDLFMHALQTDSILAPSRGQEGVPLDVDDYKRLTVCKADADEQEEVDRLFSLDKLAREEVRTSPKGTNAYDHTTIQNIFRSRYSVDSVRSLVRQHERQRGFRYTHVVLARPDVRYDKPVAWVPRLSDGDNPHIWVPNHCQWHGVCDRFAAGTAEAMLTVVMQQWTDQVRADGPYFKRGMWMAERAFCEQLKRMPSLRVSVMPVCIRRVRSDNTVYDLDLDLRPTVDAPTCLGKQYEAATSDMAPPCPALPSRHNIGARRVAKGAHGGAHSSGAYSSGAHSGAHSGAPHRSAERPSRNSSDPPSFDDWWERYQAENNIKETRSEARAMERDAAGDGDRALLPR
tara:strand:+ start:75 stop:1316 length:1242 start_codon:yes stop_codon:yes gene_type:complete